MSILWNILGYERQKAFDWRNGKMSIYVVLATHTYMYVYILSSLNNLHSAHWNIAGYSLYILYHNSKCFPQTSKLLTTTAAFFYIMTNQAWTTTIFAFSKTIMYTSMFNSHYEWPFGRHANGVSLWYTYYLKHGQVMDTL